MKISSCDWGFSLLGLLVLDAASAYTVLNSEQVLSSSLKQADSHKEMQTADSGMAACGTPNTLRIAPGAASLMQLPGAGIDPFKASGPFDVVLKSGFLRVTCVKDYMYYHGDKFGAGKHSYELGGTAPVSIVHYNDWVVKEDRKEMSPTVCFEFCRSVPKMGFFGILNGNKCYCEPYFQAVASDSSDCDTLCEGDPSNMCGGESKSTIFSMHACEKMVQEHRSGDIKLLFSTRTLPVNLHQVENTAGKKAKTPPCLLKGTLTDKDDAVGNLGIDFKIDWLWYAITETKSGKVLYEEKVGPNGISSLRVEGNNFVITGHNKTVRGEGKAAQFRKALVQKEHALVHIGEGVLLETHEVHWQRVINKYGTSELEEQEDMAKDRFKHDLLKLMSDKNGNAIVELAIALSNAGVSGKTYPCAFPMLLLAQEIRDYGSNNTGQTMADVNKLVKSKSKLTKKLNNAAKKKEQSNLLQEANADQTDDGVMEQENGETQTKQKMGWWSRRRRAPPAPPPPPACIGCSNNCNNGCLGLCGKDCSHWGWVCDDSPTQAFKGCCVHDGWCSCGGKSWHKCWLFHGSCSTTGCAMHECSKCSDCKGDGRRRRGFRRRLFRDPQTYSQATATCTPR